MKNVGLVFKHHIALTLDFIFLVLKIVQLHAVGINFK